ncbi:MAG TPA: protein kinase [Pirellulales bacterium]|jgi:serine/threonine protein kinase
MAKRELSIALKLEIDAACDAFEARLQRGEHPNIQDVLATASPDAVPQLAVELLKVAVEYAGTRPCRAECDYETSTTSKSRTLHDNPRLDGESLGLPVRPQSLKSDIPVLPPGIHSIGDFELLELIGTGGMGAVYKARQASINRLCAVKILNLDRWKGVATQERARAIDRFLREACATAAHEHPNVISVYHGGCADGTYFLAMQFVEGSSLAELVREAPFENQRAAECLEPICRGLHAVHTAGILHRDLKPSNILIERATGHAFLSDFGLAKIDGNQDLTLSGDTFGSPPYMSPEQVIDAGRTTVASDVYGLGATMYHLLTGRPPFQAATVPGTLHQVLSDDPAPPRLLNPSVDRDIETICLKCLDKDSTRRYPTALAVAVELQRYLAGHPIEARPLRWTGKAMRWTRRHPATGALLTALLATIISALCVTSVLLVRERASTNRANSALAEKGKLLKSAYLRSASLDQWPVATSAIPWVAASLAVDGESDKDYVDRVRARRLFNTCPRLIRQVDHSADIVVSRLREDGKLAFTADLHGNACLWETSNPRALPKSLPHPSSSRLRAAIFTADGSKLVTSSADGWVYVWDVNACELLASAKCHAKPISSLSLSRDDRWLATGIGDRTARVWDLASLESVTPPLLHGGAVTAIAISSQMQCLVTVASDGTLSTWTIPEGQQTVYQAPKGNILKTLAIDSSGKQFLTATLPRGVQQWGPSWPEKPDRLIDTVSAVASSHLAANDGEAIISTSAGQILQWSTATLDSPISTQAVGAGVRKSVLSHDGLMLAVCTNHNAIELWSRADSKPFRKTAEISRNGLRPTGVSVSYNAKTLLSTESRQARVWDTESRGNSLVTLAKSNIAKAYCTPDQNFLVVGDGTTRTAIHHLDASLKAFHEIQHVSQPVYPLAQHKSPFLVIGEAAGHIHVINLQDRKEMICDFSDLAPITAVAVSPDGQMAAVGNPFGRIRLFTTSDSIARADFNADESVHSLAFDEAGSSLLGICPTSFFRWTIGSIERPQVSPIGHRGVFLTSASHSALGTLLLDSQHQVWAFPSKDFGGAAQFTLEQQPYAVWSNEDNSWCAAAMPGNELRVIDFSDGQATSTFMSHPGKIQCASFGANNRLVVTGCEDHFIRVWDVKSAALVCQIATPDPSEVVACIFAEHLNGVLAVFTSGQAMFADLRPDDRSVEEIECEARLVSGQHIDHTGALSPVSAEGLERDWRILMGSQDPSH